VCSETLLNVRGGDTFEELSKPSLPFSVARSKEDVGRARRETAAGDSPMTGDASAGDIVEMDDLLASGESVEKKRAPSRKLGAILGFSFFN